MYTPYIGKELAIIPIIKKSDAMVYPKISRIKLSWASGNFPTI